MNRIVSILLLMIVSFISKAQSEVEMADKLRAEGKIYVVVAIILVVLGGFIFYMFSIDRKIKGLEKKLAEKKSGEVS